MKAILAGSPRDALLATPMRAHLEVPIRPVDQIQPFVEMMPVRGKFGFVVDAEGNRERPSRSGPRSCADIVAADDPSPVPISFDSAAIYDGDQARFKVVALRNTDKVLDVTAGVTVHASDVLAGSVPWEANADVAFAKFPIGAVTGFVDENMMDGDLNGTIAVRDLHKAGALDVNLDLANVSINGTRFGDTTTKVTARDGTLTADASVKQLDGSADVHATGGLVWGDAVAPSLDDKKPIDVSLLAKNFRVGMFAPFVRSVLSELDGRLNANTKIHVLPGMKDGTMDGAVVLDKGLFESPDVGEEFHNLRARVYMKPWGVWNVAEISADGTTGHFTANAVAKVKGLAFRSGEAHLRIAEKDKLPLTAQGIELGTVWGQIDTKAAVVGDGKTINVDVNVPKLHVALPDSLGHGVQSTDQDPSIKVGSIQKDGVVAILPVDGSLPSETSGAEEGLSRAGHEAPRRYSSGARSRDPARHHAPRLRHTRPHDRRRRRDEDLWRNRNPARIHRAPGEALPDREGDGELHGPSGPTIRS